MKHKTKSRILPVILILSVFVAMGIILAPRFLSRSQVVQPFQNDAKDKQVADLLDSMNANPNKESEEYKALRKKFCLLTARPESERARAIANIREFLHGIYPAVSKEFEPEFICSRFNGKPDDSGTDYNNPATEYYEAENHSFEIDPKTNYIIGVGDAERTKRTDPLPSYDYTPRYTAEQTGEVAQQFLIDHKGILGIDVTKMTRKYEGTKDGGDGIHPGKLVNYFYYWENKNVSVTKEHEVCGDVDETREGAYQNAQGVWCIKMKSTNYQRIDVTITNGGQIIIYRNNINDLEKL